ncbi:3-oxoacyl-ACP reductase FabG [Thiotrichales bacterium 19S3-7]|nr:3-oxoacyl-ACP reductase FabG [Thiotrichales bacterium 19S3-7]MCF6802867.1 3-oxoacyl-ACP reductase FabG [Thiotrichales bacterium 19S3-11]
MHTILVTGASKGIGKQAAIALARRGFRVACHFHRDQLGAQSTLDEIKAAGGMGYLVSFDIASATESKEVLLDTIAQQGAFYGIVNNAGITKDGAFPALTETDWNSVIHTNLDSFYHVINPCIMPMIRERQGGRIITVASVSGIMGNRGQVNYSAAKAGIIGATKALAVELAKRKITVNCVAPGLIATDMTKNLDYQEEMIKQIPLRRMGKAEEVADLIAFLASNEAAYITRQVISINGGLI